MDIDSAFALIARAIESSRLPSGYLVCGDTRSAGLRLVEKVLLSLFPEEQEQVLAKNHPDIIYLLPEGRSHTISVESMRQRLVLPMEQTSFSGGWKVGVILDADAMQVSAANSFLKTLEEPSQKTLFFLLTDLPDMLLPTIRSRTQRLDLSSKFGILEGDDYFAVAEIMNAQKSNGVFDKSLAAHRLAEVLSELKANAEDEDVARVRNAFYKTLLSFAREWMINERVPRHRAFCNVESIEEAARQSARSMPDEAVICLLFDRLMFPVEEEAK